jgi:hypothetical protein
MPGIPENPDENSAVEANFYGQWLKLAFRGTWGVMGAFTTIAGLVLASIADQKPAWASPALIEKLNSLGGWKVPILIFSSVLVARLILAPYWIWKKERKRAQKLQDKLDDYDDTPVFPFVEIPSNIEPIRVKLINKGKDSEPVESVCLYLSDGEKNEPFRILKPGEDGKTMPFTMGRKTNQYVTFDICGAHCIQWGVKSVFAVVILQDGREREGERYTIRNSDPLHELLIAPVEHVPERTWEKSMVRHKRIYKVANAYRAACRRKTSNVAGINRWRELNEAQIRELEDASEVRELLAIFDANKIPHPFQHGETAEAILYFYTEAIPKGISIGGIVEWTKAYNHWFGASLPIPE